MLLVSSHHMSGLDKYVVDSSWNVMAHGDTRVGKWRGNWRMQWVASTLHTTSEHGVSSITTADAHTSAAGSRMNWRPPADLNGLANAVGSQYSSHYLGTWCIQHYYRWCAHLGCQQSTELTPPPADLNGLGPFRAKDEIWFLRVCHHISNAVYHHVGSVTCTTMRWVFLPLCLLGQLCKNPEQNNFLNSFLYL